MSIPANQQQIIDVLMRGEVSAGGGGDKLPAWHFYYQRTPTALPINKAAVAAAFAGATTTTLLACLNVRYSQTTVGVRVVNDGTDPYLETSEAGVGAVTGDSLPTFNAAYVLIRSAMRGKPYRGSRHLFPISESDTTSGTDDILNAAALTRFNTFLTAWLAGFTAAGDVFTPVIFNKSGSQISVNPTTVLFTPINQLIMRKSIGRMKRREIGSVY